MQNSLFFQERLSDVLFFIGVNFWYLFLIAAILFGLLAVKSFKDRIDKELEMDNLNHWLLYLSKLDKLSEIEDHILNFKTYIDIDGSAIYIKRGETYILQAQDISPDIELPTRLHKKDLHSPQKVGRYYFYYLISHSKESLLMLISKKEIEIENYEGFVEAALSFYEKSRNISEEQSLQNVSTASREVLKNIFKIQYTGDMFLKFVISLLIKRLNATGLILRNKDNPKKAVYFKNPQKSQLQKRFFIRNTPYVLELFREQPLSAQEVTEVGSFLDLAGAYFENASENSKMVQNYIKFLQFSVRALELRSKYFKNHSKKVEIVSVEVAKSLFLSDSEIKTISLGAYFHDIGMIGKIEHFIDSKEVDKKDLHLIRYHPIVGAVIVEPIAHIYNIVPIIKYHHERYDGSGYPFGLKGKEIPLNAQIVALAEYYVGITSPRAYRDAMSFESAIEDIKNKKNHLVESGVIEAFLECSASIKKKIDLLEIA